MIDRDELQPGIDAAAKLLSDRRLAFITGAGVSTDSGIPDYRGAGSAPRTPMDITAFLTSLPARQRYWAGGHRGWKSFHATQPNATHFAVAQMEVAGIAVGVSTQNVDGLHTKAGSKRVVELHGSGSRVICTQCQHLFDRAIVAEQIEAENPWVLSSEQVELGPDGDATPDSYADFVVPLCPLCRGILRPDIVFFGEFIPRERFARAEEMIAEADGVVVAGTSLAVNSPIRLLARARKRGLPIVIINRGPTKWDANADIKIDGGTSDVLPALAKNWGVD